MPNATSQQVRPSQFVPSPVRPSPVRPSQNRPSQNRHSQVPATLTPVVGVRRLLELAVKLVIGSVLFVLAGVLLAAWRPDLLMLIWNFGN